MFFIFLPAAVLAITFPSSEGVVRRQIWPAPGNPNFFWNGPRDDRDFFDGDVFWPGPPRYGRPVRFDEPSRNQNDFRDDFNFERRSDGAGRNDGRNQNRRATTENLETITSTPRTIHVAPEGCQCPMTQQFNPVCGTDGNTYRNKGLLNCYSRCGSNVSEKRLGTC